MRRIGLLAALALALWQTAAFGQMSHQHASEAACDEPALRCASKVTPAFAPDGTLWLAWMAGGQVSVASSTDGGHTFTTPVQLTRQNAQPRLGAGCPSQDCRRQEWRDRRGVLDLQGQGLQRSGPVHAVDRRRQEFRGPASRSRRTTRASALKPSRWMRTVPCSRHGWTSAVALPAAARGQEIRRRGSVLRVIEGWRRHLHRSAAREGRHLRMLPPGSGVRRTRANRWSCSGTSSKAASGITRS